MRGLNSLGGLRYPEVSTVPTLNVSSTWAVGVSCQLAAPEGGLDWRVTHLQNIGSCCSG